MDGRDYSLPRWYFITLEADCHQPLFGNVLDGKMIPNKPGALTERFWAEIPQRYNHIALGACQVTFNHFHGLLQITRAGGKVIGEVLNMFKESVTREWRRSTGTLNTPNVSSVWAPNDYDVICFNANELHVRTRYIQANPKRRTLRDLPEDTRETCQKANHWAELFSKQFSTKISRHGETI